jgi:uncharacterized coiled-coil protein SlyX
MSSSESKPFKLNSFLPILTYIVAIAVSYGTLYAQVSELEKRVSTLEERTLGQLESINKGMMDLRVEVAKVSQDMEWLKEKIKEN